MLWSQKSFLFDLALDKLSIHPKKIVLVKKSYQLIFCFLDVISHSDKFFLTCIEWQLEQFHSVSHWAIILSPFKRIKYGVVEDFQWDTSTLRSIDCNNQFGKHMCACKAIFDLSLFSQKWLSFKNLKGIPCNSIRSLVLRDDRPSSFFVTSRKGWKFSSTF